MALFAAIVAVGLGPAMWVGAQFAPAAPPPVGPPVVTGDRVQSRVSGGAGAAPGAEVRVLDRTADTWVGSRSAVPAGSASTTHPKTRKSAPPVDRSSASPDRRVPPRPRLLPASPDNSPLARTETSVAPPTDAMWPSMEPAGPKKSLDPLNLAP